MAEHHQQRQERRSRVKLFSVASSRLVIVACARSMLSAAAIGEIPSDAIATNGPR